MDTLFRFARGGHAVGSIVLAVLMTTAAPAAAEESSIGVYADPQGTQPCIDVAPGSMATLYLVATPAGQTAGGLTGAEFRIRVTHPEGYQFFFVPPQGALVLGNPLDDTPQDPTDLRGCNIAFSDCQTGGKVAFGTLLVLNVAGGPTELITLRRSVPSNSLFNCALFTACDAPKAGPLEVQFAKHCMQPCGTDAAGSVIAGHAAINLPGCPDVVACSTPCGNEPCVRVSSASSGGTCVGTSVTVTATATNCGTQPEDLEVFVRRTSVGVFTAVQPGQSVTASRTDVLPVCPSGYDEGPLASAIARSQSCAAPASAETGAWRCGVACGPNHDPDCSHATVSLAQIWPPDGRWVPVRIDGVTDADGDALSYRIDVIGTDEPVTTGGHFDATACPDAIIDEGGQVRLRAERDLAGDGRIYRIPFAALDGRSGSCGAILEVCVPRKPGGTCPPSIVRYVATSCMAAGATNLRTFTTHPLTGGALDLEFATAEGGDIELDLYDVRGRQVAQITRSRFAPGTHIVRWDGLSTSGKAIANGVYILRVRAGGEVLTSKIVIAR